jgi:hypothetical protein
MRGCFIVRIYLESRPGAGLRRGRSEHSTHTNVLPSDPIGIELLDAGKYAADAIRTTDVLD